MSADDDDEEIDVPDEDIEEEAEYVSGPGTNEHDIAYKESDEPNEEGDGEEDEEPEPEDGEDPEGVEDEEPDDDDEPVDVEEEADFVSGPGTNEHDIKYKDPVDGDGDDDQEPPADVEEEADFVSGPGTNEHDIKYKDPVDGDDDQEPPADVEEEADFVSGPSDTDHDIKYKDPDDAPENDDMDTNATFSLKPPPPADQQQQPSAIVPQKPTPTWKRKPLPPPEPIPFPPQDKPLYQILKEEKISPTKRYAPKPCTKSVLIPFIIPWEFTPAKETQHGMGAFGHVRNPFTKIEDGAIVLKQGSVHTETVLSLFAQNNKFASNTGQVAFGSHRSQIGKVIDNHKFDTSKLKFSQSIVTKQAIGSFQSQSGQTPIGSLRSQTPHIKYLDGMSPRCDRNSDTFLSRQWAPNTNCRGAGSGIMDRRRNVVPHDSDGAPLAHSDPQSACIVPKLFDTQDLEKPVGSGGVCSPMGAFRPLVSRSEGGYRMDYEEERDCNLWVPFQTKPSLQQECSGGFGKLRDVVNVINY